MQQQEEADEKKAREPSARYRFSVRLEGPKAVLQVVENLFLSFESLLEPYSKPLLGKKP